MSMDQREWKELKDKLGKLSPVQRLHVLVPVLEKVKGELKKEVEVAVKEAQAEFDAMQEWKRTSVLPLSSRRMVEEEPSPRPVRHEESSLEEVVQKEPVATGSEEQKGYVALSSLTGEYKGMSYEDAAKQQEAGVRGFQSSAPVYTPQKSRGASETESDAMARKTGEAERRLEKSATEMYKRKDRRSTL